MFRFGNTLRSLLRAPKSTAAKTTSQPRVLYATAAPITASLAMAVSAYTSAIAKVPVVASTPEDAAAKPHHVKKGDKVVGFKNPHPSWEDINPATFVPYMLWSMATGKWKYPDTTPPTLTVRKPEFLPDRTASDKLRATWLGHACYYVEFPSGLRVLFDPVFEDRCSPFSFMGPKRFTPKPCELADIPIVDAVVISHSHYDHLSHDSVLEIQKHNPRAHFFVGLGLESWFKNAGLKNVTELDWWENAEITLTLDQPAADGEEKGANGAGAAAAKDPKTISATISSLPCQHTSARTAFDKDTTLWCSWAIETGGKSVWFGGDTGYRRVPRDGMDRDSEEFTKLPYCPQFKQIGEYRGPFDLGLIPIGAYHPRIAFSSMHANPYDSVEIFQDTRCEKAMGIHWGTWALTFEDVWDPPKLLEDALERKGIPVKGVFDVCDIGESREF